VFIIGGVYGLDASLRNRADLVLGFSQFTFTHQMIRLLLVEQLYRAYTILQGKTYHY
jgi:23S rRNA (pseudouridine1915-N3)-methyltransferase